MAAHAQARSRWGPQSVWRLLQRHSKVRYKHKHGRRLSGLPVPSSWQGTARQHRTDRDRLGSQHPNLCHLILLPSIHQLDDVSLGQLAVHHSEVHNDTLHSTPPSSYTEPMWIRVHRASWQGCFSTYHSPSEGLGCLQHDKGQAPNMSSCSS